MRIDDRRESGASSVVLLRAPNASRAGRPAELWTPPRVPWYRFGTVEADFKCAEVRRDGEPVALAAKEFLLLRYFVEHRGELLTRNELLDGVWGYDAMPLTRTVDVHVAWLRKKLEPEPRQPRFIITVYKLGYKFVG
ncbi:MAG TPA: winged helix-turn-helix domain-containing protein [Vicinamibacteria bacterium]|nr:winged helix-turn-helix domain-containing protein [Vicinamibacteria bacterium]